MKIGIIGTGIAGNVISYNMHQGHDITVFDAADYIGGHTHTHDITYENKRYQIDTGFIVFNDWTYPNFIKLLDTLGVETETTDMSFSCHCMITDLEYNGSNLNTLFAQRSNIFRPKFYRMLRDILRFNKNAPELLKQEYTKITLGTYLEENKYSDIFIENYIIPMGAAIWSTDPEQMSKFPARFFVQFFSNHGLLNINDRPQWRVIKGGSNYYVKKLIEKFRDRIRLHDPVVGVSRHSDYVTVTTKKGYQEKFDQLFIACHSNQALKILRDPAPLEKEILSSIQYQKNTVVLHTDIRQLPKRKRTWAAWNYLRRNDNGRNTLAITYNMNILQNIKAPVTFCVTLNNDTAIDPDCILKSVTYEHPLFTPGAVNAQERQQEINGINRTYFCGAYWRYGFHEDGVISAQNAIKHFKERNGHA